jgi:hypothetical protein
MLPRNLWNIDNVTDNEQKMSAITLFSKDVSTILNKNVAFADNIKGTLLSVTFTGANTNTQVRHGLAFTPSNYIVVGLSANMVVYDGTETNNGVYANFQATATGTARIFVF